MVLCVEEVQNLSYAFPTDNDHESIIHVPKLNFYAQTFQLSHNFVFQSINEEVSVRRWAHANSVDFIKKPVKNEMWFCCTSQEEFL